MTVSGCGKEQRAADAKAGDGKATTLTFWTFQELHKNFIDDGVATWNTNHPDKPIVVKTEVYLYDEMHNKLLIAIQSGTGAPDMADIELGKFANFLKGSKPGLVEFNDVIEPVKDKLIMGRLENYAKSGKYYGLDYHVGAEVMYYNKEILDQAGINVNDIVTWDDYIAAGKKVVEKTGKPMTTLESMEKWSYYPLICMQGSDAMDKDGMKKAKCIVDKDYIIAKNPALENFFDKEVIMGIRPEDLYDNEECFKEFSASIVNAFIEVTELMGAETYLFMKVEGSNFVARVNPKSTAKAGDTVKIAIDTNKIHIFDKDTEKIILN
nr:extracellular solute-binding protein [Pelosinus baikalensis]